MLCVLIMRSHTLVRKGGVKNYVWNGYPSAFDQKSLIFLIQLFSCACACISLLDLESTKAPKKNLDFRLLSMEQQLSKPATCGSKLLLRTKMSSWESGVRPRALYLSRQVHFLIKRAGFFFHFSIFSWYTRSCHKCLTFNVSICSGW